MTCEARSAEYFNLNGRLIQTDTLKSPRIRADKVFTETLFDSRDKMYLRLAKNQKASQNLYKN